jgi:hypothetical protein
MQTLSRPVRQFAAVGLLLAAIVLVASLTILPVSARISELREQIENQRLLLGRGHHFRIELLAARCSRARRTTLRDLRRFGFRGIFSVLHGWPLSRASAIGSRAADTKTTLPAFLIRKLKLRASAGSPPGDGAQVVMIIADGVRPDVLARAIARGDLPALAGLKEEGSLSTVTSARVGSPMVSRPSWLTVSMVTSSKVCGRYLRYSDWYGLSSATSTSGRRAPASTREGKRGRFARV